jgi:TonB-dependent starch-binding outer membrane protein SusC
MNNFGLSIKKICCFSITLFLFLTIASKTVDAQQREARTISGTVIDAKGKFPLTGASIVLKNSYSGTIADLEGKYSIMASRGDTLVFSFIGYQTKEFVLENETIVNIQLTESLQNLDEVVVIGYGSTLKKEVTGAISSIKGR